MRLKKKKAISNKKWFGLWTAYFNLLINLSLKLVDEGAWKPIKITKEGLNISHLFFADDVLLFSQANIEQM